MMISSVTTLLKRMASGGLFIAVSAACVNHITESGLQFPQSDMPLRIVANISPSVTTRVVDNAFEERDEVGLFALAGGANLAGERYIDNTRFVRSSSGEFVSADSVFYPAGEIALDLISYYPYRPGGVAKGESKMPVSVAADQQEATAHSCSDFLVASKQQVLPDGEPVRLTYRHKCFLLKIVLTLGEGEDAETLLALDPKIKIVGFYTQALYDFRRQHFSDFSEVREMAPFGKWEIVDERLEGKQLILIPQEKALERQYILLEVGGKQYISFLPASLHLESGKQRELEISFVTAKEQLMSGLKGEIEDWRGGETDKVSSQLLKRSVDVRQIPFQFSNVYRVMSGRGQVAEICKEYLITPTFSSQAIVAYPMTQQGSVDLTRGQVLQLLDREGRVHGGLVSWDAAKHTLSYTPGNLSPQNYLYVQMDGTISFTPAISEEPLPVWVQSDVVHDAREGADASYPLVKIGTQYWLRSNLSTTAVQEQTSFAAESAGYLRSFSGTHIYYTVAALTPTLLPARCGIPTWQDWKILMEYLKQDASVMKGGDWQAATVDGLVQPATNFSGFDALPAGMYVAATESGFYEGKYVGYWTLNDTGTAVADSVPLLRSNTNRLEKALTAKERKAFPIRCICK